MTPIRTSLAALALAAIAAPALAQSTPTTNNATNISNNYFHDSPNSVRNIP